MRSSFTADEIFEMAEQIERNGGKFYRAAAEKFPAVRDILLRLAEWEDEHVQTFAAMRTELAAGPADPPVFDPDGQSQIYLRAMADGHVFDPKADPGELVDETDTPEDILHLAISVERDSIAFYAGLKQSISAAAGRDKVEAIIKEEVNHVAILSTELDALASKESKK